MKCQQLWSLVTAESTLTRDPGPGPGPSMHDHRVKGLMKVFKEKTHRDINYKMLYHVKRNTYNLIV